MVCMRWLCGWAACGFLGFAGADEPPAGAGDFGDAPPAAKPAPPAEKRPAPAPVAAAAPKPPALVWADNLNAALATAKQNGKAVLVEFQSQTCPVCRKLEKTTFADPGIAAALGKGCVLARVDCEVGAGEAAAKKHDIAAYPTLVFFDANETPLHRHVGYLGPNLLAEKLVGVEDVRRLPELQAKLQAAPMDLELAARVQWAQCLKGDFDGARDTAKAAAEAGMQGTAHAKALNRLGDLLQERHQYADAIGYFENAAKAGAGREKAYALLSVGACHLSQDRFDLALKAAEAGLAVPGMPADLKAEGEEILAAAQAGLKAKN